jgi:hypothetical protein
MREGGTPRKGRFFLPISFIHLLHQLQSAVTAKRMFAKY